MIAIEDIQKQLGSYPENLDALPMLVSSCRDRSNRVIPFVGAGLSRPFGFPLWGDFLRSMAANRPRLRDKIETRLRENQYEEAASDIEQELFSAIFQDKIRASFGDSLLAGKRIEGAVLQLTRFPAARIITTNFDRVLEICFRQQNLPLRTLCGLLTQYPVEALQQNKPFLLKLHGDWEDFATRILTLEEYTKAYGDATPEQVDLSLPLPDLLKVLLTTSCMLFVGCSLNTDRTMRVLARITKNFPNRIVHFAIVERPDGKTQDEADEAAFHRTAELHDLSIVPIWYPYKQHSAIEAILTFLAEQFEDAATDVKPSPRRKIPNNIPVLGNATVGLDADIAALMERLVKDSKVDRLMTILGPGGGGKSRLAIEVAAAVQQHFPDGVWYVALSDLEIQENENNLLPSRIGKVIGLSESHSQPPYDALLAYLCNGRQLLVFDSCEHITKFCAEVAGSLLRGCPGLKVLATSRKLLEETTFESVYPLHPLTVPPDNEDSLAVVSQSSAVQLFIERAKQRQPDFALNLENATFIAKICRALDGIPLAIEIAAARLVNKTAEEISQATDGLLNRGFSGDLRHWKTMSAAISWSYNLLTPELQRFVRDLSVFVGGWKAAAATSVTSQSLDRDQVDDYLEELLNSSLIVREKTAGRLPYRFLDPIRQFVQQQEPLETEDRRKRHADFFLGIAEQAAPKFLTGEQNAALEATQLDVDNFRAALHWACDARQPEYGLRLMVAIWRFMEIRAYYTEGLDLASKIVAIPGTENFSGLKCRLLSGAGMLKYRMADFAGASEFFQQCFDLATSHDDQVERADALSGLGLVAMMKGAFAEAQAFQTQCRDLERLNNNARNAAVATYNLGFIALGMGNTQDALVLLNESLQQFESANNDRERAFALNSLARCSIVLKDFEAAERQAGKALEIRRKLSDNKTAADSLRTLAWAALETAQYRDAFDFLKEGITLARGVNDSRGVSEALELFALVSARSGDEPRTVRLIAAADKIRGPYGYALPPALIAERQTVLSQIKEHLGEQKYSQLWSAGRDLEMSSAVGEALGIGTLIGPGKIDSLGIDSSKVASASSSI